MNFPETIHVAAIGVGSFGRNHARVYRELALSEPDRVKLVALVDAQGERAREAAGDSGASVFTSVEEMLSARERGELRIDAASVAVPTSAHLGVSRALMEAGIDVLIEKPIASDVSQALALERIAEKTRRVAMVGQLERFNPAVLAARGLLNGPMFFECHRLSVFTPRSLDVDVVLDLMIHDLDVVLSMVSAKVCEVRAVGLPVLTKKVDIANVRVEFENGCVANFTASRVSTERVRKLRLFQPHEYLSLDYGRQDLLRIQVDASVLQALAGGGIPAMDGSPGVEVSRPPVEKTEPLRAEIESFLAAVRTRSTPAVPLAEGTRALGLALEIRRSIEEHRSRAGLG